MNTEKALNMVEQYILSDCTDREWRKCLRYIKWLIVHDKELIDKLAITNESLRKTCCACQETIAEKQEMLDATIAGQEKLQKHFTDTHHNETEMAYKNGYAAGVTEFAEKFKADRITKCENKKLYWIIEHNEFDNLAKELIGGADNDRA